MAFGVQNTIRRGLGFIWMGMSLIHQILVGLWRRSRPSHPLLAVISFCLSKVYIPFINFPTGFMPLMGCGNFCSLFGP